MAVMMLSNEYFYTVTIVERTALQVIGCEAQERNEEYRIAKNNSMKTVYTADRNGSRTSKPTSMHWTDWDDAFQKGVDFNFDPV